MKKKINKIPYIIIFTLLSLNLSGAPKFLHFEIYAVSSEPKLDRITELQKGTSRDRHDEYLNQISSEMKASKHWSVSVNDSGEFDWTDGKTRIVGKVSDLQENPNGFPISIKIIESIVSQATGEEKERVRLSIHTLLPVDDYSILLSGMSYKVDADTQERAPTYFEFQRMRISENAHIQSE